MPELYFPLSEIRESKAMSKRKKKREKRSVPVDELRQGPIRHKQGLSPLLSKLAKANSGCP
jgi:hypothetical protein